MPEPNSPELVDELGPRVKLWRRVLGGFPLDNGSDLRKPVIQLAGVARPEVQDGAGFTALVDNSALGDVAIDCFERGRETSDLVYREPLRH